MAFYILANKIEKHSEDRGHQQSTSVTSGTQFVPKEVFWCVTGHVRVLWCVHVPVCVNEMHPLQSVSSGRPAGVACVQQVDHFPSRYIDCTQHNLRLQKSAHTSAGVATEPTAAPVAPHRPLNTSYAVRDGCEGCISQVSRQAVTKPTQTFQADVS